MHKDFNQAILIISSLILTVIAVLATYYFIVLKSGETQGTQESAVVTPAPQPNITEHKASKTG
jgi:flagellar basal body-associated protein FliL